MYRNPNIDDSPCSSDDDNPWSKFRRVSRTANYNTYADVNSIGHGEMYKFNDDFEDSTNEVAQHAHRRKLFVDNSEDCYITGDDDDDSNSLTGGIHARNVISNIVNETIDHDDNSMIVDADDEHNNSAHISTIVGNRRTPRYTVPWDVDESMDVQFALECSIEGCNCTENWREHRQMLHAIYYHHHNDNSSGNALPDEHTYTSERQLMASDSKDYGSSIQHTTCTVKSCMCQQNEWSPFVHHGSSTRIGDEEDLAPMNQASPTEEFEVIEWAQGDSAELYLDTGKMEHGLSAREAYNTPTTSPILDLSGLDGYHTAPNSPAPSLSEDYCIIEKCKENSTNNHALQDVNSDVTDGHSYIQGDTRVVKEETSGRRCDEGDVITAKGEGRDDMNNGKKCAKCHRNMTEPCILDTPKLKAKPVNAVAGETKQLEEDMQPTRQETNERTRDIIGDARAQDIPNTEHVARYSKRDPRVLTLKTPPFLYHNDLFYEGNTDTREAKVVGKGSFGVVYKARFSDPKFQNIQIVVKEFNEEFSSSSDIFDEARRLYYLQNTGFVPICYGILKYSQNDRFRYGIVQELVGTGLTLEQMLWDRYELPMENWYRIALQSCEGLARFHDKGILLNDIKSNNILLEFNERHVRIRYIDFGLATDMRGKRYKNTKSLEDFVYLAPEVRLNGSVTNIASDIYSLGFMLNQIRKYSGLHEITMVANLCMDMDPSMRLPVRGAASLLHEQMKSFNLMNSKLDN